MPKEGTCLERLPKNRVLLGMVYTLLILVILYLLMQLRPMISGVYWFLREILTPFIIALIISYVLNPVVSLLGARKVPRTIAVLLIYALFIMSMTVILMNVIPMLVRQLAELNEHMPDVSFKAQSLVDDLNGLQFFAGQRPDRDPSIVGEAGGRHLAGDRRLHQRDRQYDQ